jgi:hypothetical protein
MKPSTTNIAQGSVFGVETGRGAHAPSRVLFAAVADHLLAPATTIGRGHHEISRALFQSARRRPVQPRAASFPGLNAHALLWVLIVPGLLGVQNLYAA